MTRKQNLTIQLDPETIRKARLLAVQRSTSVSRLVAEEIERLVGDAERYARAKQKALAVLARGFDMGDGPLPSRHELHDR